MNIDLIRNYRDPFFVQQELDGQEYIKENFIRLPDYQAVFDNSDTTTKQWLLEYTPPWTFNRILELMDMKGQPLPAILVTPFPYKGAGEYRARGRIAINSELDPYKPYLVTLLDTCLSVFIHELQHHKQFITGRLIDVWDGLERRYHAFWEGERHHIGNRVGLSPMEYNNLPWEKEANIVAYDVVKTLIAEGHVRYYHTPLETIHEYYERTRGYFEDCRKTEESNTLSDLP